MPVPQQTSSLPQPTIALVTGGGRGIGRATAERLALAGATVVITYNTDRASAEAAVAQLAGTGHLALPLVLQDSASIAAAVSVIETRFGRLDILVNNGGATTPVPAADLDGLTDALFDDVLITNLRGTFAVIRACRKLLEVPPSAVIVNVSSIAARTGIGSSLAYCAAKAGVDALTIGLAKALAPGIRVLAVAPAGVDTGFVKGRRSEDFEALAQRTPLAKTTSPDDVARAIMACVAHLTSSTGIVIPVDEGRHL